MKRQVDNSEKLEKFIKGQIALYDVDFASSDSYNFETTPEAKELAETIKYCYNNQIPLIIYNYNNDTINISYLFDDDSNVHLIRVSPNTALDIFIQSYEDRIEITITAKQLLSSDNMKSVFNQSITGTGNIDLYMHYLKVDDGHTTWFFQFISSNKLVVDSLQDLNTLIKPTNNSNLFITCVDDETNANGLLTYSTNVWKVIHNNVTSNIINVHDVVKTI